MSYKVSVRNIKLGNITPQAIAIGGGIKAAYLGNKMVWGDYYIGEQVDLQIKTYFRTLDDDGTACYFDWRLSIYNDNEGYDVDMDSGSEMLDARDDWYYVTYMTDKINDLILSKGIQYLINMEIFYSAQSVGRTAHMSKSNDGYWYCQDEIFEVSVWIFDELIIHGVGYGLCGWDGAAGNAYGGRIDYTDVEFDIGDYLWEGDTKIKDGFKIAFSIEKTIYDLQDANIKVQVNSGRKAASYKVKIIY